MPAFAGYYCCPDASSKALIGKDFSEIGAGTNRWEGHPPAERTLHNLQYDVIFA
jgi:hypothetical protein